jgi:hypothetical protein
VLCEVCSAGIIHSRVTSAIKRYAAMLKKNIITGLITAISIMLFLVLIFTLKSGVSWWTDKNNEILIFFPIWFLLLIYVGYGTSKYYHSQKQLFFNKYTENEIDAKDKWEAHKKLMLSRLLMIIARLFAIMTPFYILAYFDKSEYLHSSMVYIISFSIIAIVCYCVSKKLKSDYKRKRTP